jgi:pimeloyl-ACP methyl ester carboxylesterase
MESEHILRYDGAELHYWLSRVPDARYSLVMLHGLASNHTRWSEFIANTRLKAECNLLRPDLRGHGASMYRGRISRARWVRDLAAILQHEKLHPAVLMGHSLGAEIALDYAWSRPEQVQGLVLIDPVFPDNLTGVLGWARRLRGLLWPLVGLLRVLNALGLRKRRFPLRDLWALDRQTRAALAAQPDEDIARLYMRPWVDLEYLPLANYLQDLLEVVRPLPPLEVIACPVLVIMSAGSSVSDKQRNEACVRRFPDARLEWIPCDHWPLTEQPDRVRTIIEDWCRQRFS